MDPDRGLCCERRAVAAGYFTLLGILWGAVAVHWCGVTKAEPLPLRAAPPDTSAGEELHLFGLLPLEGLLPSLKDLSMRRSFVEALPEDWALPKFSPSSAAELLELQTWLSKVKEQIDFDTLRNTPDPLGPASVKGEPLAMQQLLNALLEPSLGLAGVASGANLLLSGADLQSALPSVLKEFTASLPLQSFAAPVDILRHDSGLSEAFLRKVQLLQRLPSLDRLDMGKFVEMFAYPSDIEWPVERRKLALLLPIVTSAEDGGLLSSPYTTLVERSGLAGITMETGKMLLPLAQPDGQLLFAKLKEIFPHMVLPQTLTLLPLATLKNTEDLAPIHELRQCAMHLSNFTAGMTKKPHASGERVTCGFSQRWAASLVCVYYCEQLSTVDALWSALKSTILPRQAILSADKSSTLIGPVLNLTNLSKLNLVSSESLRKQFLTYLLPSSEMMEKTQSTGANSHDSGSKELLKAFAEALEAGFPLEDTVKNVFNGYSTKLQQALLPFEGLIALDGTLPASRFKSLADWKGDWDHFSPAEFRDELFFRLQVPIVALSRNSVAHAFRQLQRLHAPCDSAGGHGTCALGLATTPPVTQEELEHSVWALSRRVEALAEQLKGLVHELQGKVSELIATTGAATGIEENEASAMKDDPPTETDTATGQRMFSTSPLRESSSTAPPSPHNFKEPEGWREGRLFDLPNTFSHNGKHSKINSSTLQQALDASVQLCDTLTVALRYTKNEVKSLGLFKANAGSSGRSGGQGRGTVGAEPLHATGYESWESPDLAFQLGSLMSGVEENESRRLPFLANIHGQALAALPRTIFNGLVTEAGVQETVIPEVDLSRASREAQHRKNEDKSFEYNEGKYYAFRRLQATQENGALATKQLVLVDPLTLGKLLFAHVNNTKLLEGLKKGITGASQAAPGVDRTDNQAHEVTPDVTLPPLLKDVLASDALSFPAFTLPAAELLRVGVFPQRLLHAPIREWVSSTVRLPAEADKYAVPELLQLHSLASQLKQLPLEDLLSGKSPAALDVFHINNDVLRHTLGDLHLKSLIPSQLADLPLQELSGRPGKKVLEANDMPEGSLGLSLEKLLAVDDAITAMLTQPFGDILGLRTLLEGLTLEEFGLSAAPARGEMSDDSSRLLGKSLPNAVVAKLAESSLAALAAGEGKGALSGEKNLVKFSRYKWLAPGSSPQGGDKVQTGDISSRKPNPLDGTFLPGKQMPEGSKNGEAPSLGSLVEGLRNHRPMTDIFRHLGSAAGVTILKELYF